MTTIHKQDFPNHKIDALEKNKINNATLRASHFKLGDHSQLPLEQYATTYSSTMVPKETKQENKKENFSFKSSLVMNGDGTNSYITESKAKYFILYFF